MTDAIRPRVLLAITLLCVLAAPAPARFRAEAPATDPRLVPLTDVPIDFRTLAARGTADFDIAANLDITINEEDGDRADLSFTSRATMKTTVERDAVTMIDVWEIMGRTIRLEMTCEKGPLLRLRRTRFEVRRHDEVMTGTLRIEGDEGHMKAGDATATVPYPAGTLMQAAAFRLVTILPRTPGVAYTFDRFTESVEVRVREPKPGERFSIECVGAARVQVGKTRVPCTKYLLHCHRPMELFVDARSRLCRVVADDGSTVMVRRTTG